MAKKSSIEKNNHRRKLSKRYSKKREALKALIHNREIAPEERFAAVIKLDGLPKNASPIRVRNRCEITGRPRAFYRKFRISRIALRDMASLGLVPGVVKSSW
ncbi:MAG TPA: 30S ribosomal protein S14 [Rhodospirillaceae bacterium]|jgi:small subunit ribosomal protein S14|nr:30S ribosomal protein S14 [Rhodospirillaceae bacterium]MAL77475.1 30S ribosomal protein S14 [Rhodospirillaceae bacterium]MBB59161.1 30S ribosomal protein S14 [Rhodospirillaceae bacterium]HAJ21094.1 30S ribosomal protein S14 [Rhodospirillaceae bacterium]|tara:strand:+ start:794 stop:1099 length:306 start_codon:yes stop_codon:yes gene_type:complete